MAKHVDDLRPAPATVLGPLHGIHVFAQGQHRYGRSKCKPAPDPSRRRRTAHNRFCDTSGRPDRDSDNAIVSKSVLHYGQRHVFELARTIRERCILRADSGSYDRRVESMPALARALGIDRSQSAREMSMRRALRSLTNFDRRRRGGRLSQLSRYRSAFGRSAADRAGHA